MESLNMLLASSLARTIRLPMTEINMINRTEIPAWSDDASIIIDDK
jgi:hypothetical protein